MIKLAKINSKSKFLSFVICFYRFIGISFGGIALDQNGDIVKSQFWYYFGWFGCCMYIVLLFFFIISSFTHYDYIIDKVNFYKILTILWLYTFVSMIGSIIIINQKYGLKIIKIVMKYSLTKFSKLKSIIIIWIIHLLICGLITVCLLVFYPKPSYILFAVLNNLFLYPLFCSISFMSWIVSVSFSENIKIIRNRITHNGALFVTSNYLNQAKNFLLINYQMINKIDHHLAPGSFTLATGIVVITMATAYYSIFVKQLNILGEFLSYNITFASLQLANFVLNCFINEKVINETRKLLCVLDNVNINVMDNQLYKSVLSLKKSVKKTKCGFTIAGFTSWNKLTLLQVRDNCYCIIQLSY